MDRDGDDPELLPVQLTRATAAAVGVDGVGLSVHDTAGHSTPLGAGDETATTAERLRFTAGSGPCTSAARSGWPVCATEDRLRTRRPAFHDLLVAHTAFRSAVALPPGDLRGSGGMDLYPTHPAGLETTDALAVLRSRAYAADRTVDDLAADLVAGRLTASQLGEDAACDR